MSKIQSREPIDTLRASTAHDALGFLVDFAQRPAATVMAVEPALRQLLTVRTEPLGSDAWQRRGATAVTDPPLSRAAVTRLQRCALDTLRALARTREDAEATDPRALPPVIGLRLRMRLLVVIQHEQDGGHTVRLIVDGPPRARLLFRITRLIDEVGGDKLRQCRCGVLFIRRWRQEWHSGACRAKYGMRKWRDENPSRKGVSHGTTRTRRRHDSRAHRS